MLLAGAVSAERMVELTGYLCAPPLPCNLLLTLHHMHMHDTRGTATSVDYVRMVLHACLPVSRYAAAGVFSSLLNAFGTGSLLRYAGMGAVLMMSPAAELAAAVGMVMAPGISAAFVGRTLDLTMRWSLNNTAKSLLWIATPRVHQDAAKPWIEGTVKKATASVRSVALGMGMAIAQADVCMSSLTSFCATTCSRLPHVAGDGSGHRIHTLGDE